VGGREALFSIYREIASAMAKARARGAIEAALLDFLNRRGLGQGDPIAVAYSGGPDSTALLFALSALGWREPIAVHVDHGIRPREELNAELALVRANCSRLGCRLIVAHVSPGAVADRARASGEGIEAEARRFRYAALRAVAARTGAKAVLMAHNRDDQLETLLMRLFGGSGAGGMRGIPERSGVFMRPFLGIGKKDLLAYLGERGQGYSIDSTNASDAYLRNRIRRDIVPALDSTFSGWRKGLARTAANAALDEEALAAAAEDLAFSACADGSLCARAADLLGASDAVAIRAIVSAVGRILGKNRISSKMAAVALDALKRGDLAGYQGAGIELRRTREDVILRRGLDFPRRDGYFVLIDRPCRVRVGKLEVNASWRSDGNPGIRADAFRFPLVLRSRRPGDSIALKDGTKRLDALFSEWGLTELSRGAAPVVEDCDGIVAVLGAGIGGKDRYRARRRGEGSEGEGPLSEPSSVCARRFSIIVKGA
jgi:tRNA(Ile)-lysidine synthase